jgi:hypothetical protein
VRWSPNAYRATSDRPPEKRRSREDYQGSHSRSPCGSCGIGSSSRHRGVSPGGSRRRRIVLIALRIPAQYVTVARVSDGVSGWENASNQRLPRRLFRCEQRLPMLRRSAISDTAWEDTVSRADRPCSDARFRTIHPPLYPTGVRHGPRPHRLPGSPASAWMRAGPQTLPSAAAQSASHCACSWARSASPLGPFGWSARAGTAYAPPCDTWPAGPTATNSDTPVSMPFSSV